MKIVDSKGKLFGRINIIDLALGIIIICLFCGIGYKIFERNMNEELVEEKVEAYITLRAVGIVPEAEACDIEGEKLIVENEISDAEIVSVKFQESKYNGMTSDGKLSIENNPLLRDVEITVKAPAVKNETGILVAGKNFRVNQDFVITTKEFYANAKIVGVRYEK